jgi:dihydroorotate dehydrogenase electron transfer subunit
MKQNCAQVISNVNVVSYSGAKYFLMRAFAPELVKECRPGQFLMIKCGTDTVLRRPISVHSAGSDYFELLYALPSKTDKDGRPIKLQRDEEPRTATGTGMKWLSELGIGHRLDIIGPMGNGFTIKPSSKNLLLISGGIGIAPLRFLADTALPMGKNVVMLLGARYKKAHYPENLLHSEIKTIRTIEKGTQDKKHRKGTIIQVVPEYVDWADQIFACGPKAMYETLARQMSDWSPQKPVQVSLEVRMGCGTGVCYSCSIKTKKGMKRVCKEGPVFDIRDIIWQEVST